MIMLKFCQNLVDEKFPHLLTPGVNIYPEVLSNNDKEIPLVFITAIKV